MKINLKKGLSLLLSSMIVCTAFTVGFTVMANDNVEISSENFPDTNFRSIISQRYDTDKDGYLSESERNVSLMNVSGLADEDDEITSLKGIEFFAQSLTVLRCGSVGLTQLDTSLLTNLTALTCQGNYLTTLDLRANSQLLTLNCADNNLTSLDISGLSNIESLHCYVNNLTSLDVSSLTKLDDLRCEQNELTSIDLSQNTQLTSLYCSSNHLSSLDLSMNTLLDSVTDTEIGNQTTTATAVSQGASISIPYTVDNHTMVSSTSLDNVADSGYDFNEFYILDVKNIENGIDYTYSTGLGRGDDMSVHIDVTRDFYQVGFFLDEEMTDHFANVYVSAGNTATSPALPTNRIPQCKALDKWSESTENVTRDMNVFAIWRDDHSYSLTAFDNSLATVTCSVCGDSFTVDFADCVNASKTDTNYSEYLDVVSDGIINAKDYAQLLIMFK